MIASVVLVLIVSGCGSKLPVRTIRWEDDGAGYTRFYTNDSQYYGYSFWYWDDPSVDPMTTVETAVKKISGSSAHGFGIIFCVQDTNNFYRILISANGGYNIWKKVNDTWTSIQSWTQSGNINQGYGAVNTIKVTRVDTTFYVYINEQYETCFDANEFSGGKSGYYVSVGDSDYEKFPNTPVDVRFNQIQPLVVKGSFRPVGQDYAMTGFGAEEAQ